MKKRSVKNMIKNAVILVLLLICVTETVILKIAVFENDKGIANIVKLQSIKAMIDHYYLEEIDEDQLESYTYKGLVAGLGDPYSTYYSKEEYKEATESTEGIFSGIGAVLQQDADTGAIKVIRVIKESPAQKEGVKANDILYKIEGEEIDPEEELSKVVARVKGREGTKVHLTFLRDKKEIDFTITRKKIESPTVEYEMLEDSIGYIQITEFDEVTVAQFQEAMEKLNQKGMKKLVLDLRDNPGGLLDSVVDIADRIIDKGMIVYTEDKNGKREEYKAKSKESFDQPLAVLINGNSASASEILAGAIQDYGIGTLVGTTSFGKGIVQTVMKMGDGSAVKLTVANYYTPKGRNIHKKGIQPDVKIEAKESFESSTNKKKSDDVQLKKAIEILENED